MLGNYCAKGSFPAYSASVFLLKSKKTDPGKFKLVLYLRVDIDLDDISIGEMYSCNSPCFLAWDSNNFGDHWDCSKHNRSMGNSDHHLPKLVLSISIRHNLFD